MKKMKAKKKKNGMKRMVISSRGCMRVFMHGRYHDFDIILKFELDLTQFNKSACKEMTTHVFKFIV